MAVLPGPSTDTIDNRPNIPNPSRFSRRLLVILGLVILLVVSVLLIFYFFYFRDKKVENQREKAIQTISTETNDLTYLSPHWQNRFDENTTQALTGESKEKQYEVLSNNFVIIYRTYIANHDSKTRQAAEKLKDFLKTTYPAQYKEDQFLLPCLDTLCGNLTYSSEVQEIVTLVKQVEFQNPQTNEAVIKKIDEANFTQDQETQWYSYNAAFMIVSSEIKYQNNKDPKARELAKKLEGYIQTNFPEKYKISNALGEYKLD